MREEGWCRNTVRRFLQPDIRITNTPFSVESAAAEGNYGADPSGADGDKSVGGGDFVTSAVTAAGSEGGTDSSEYEYYYVEYEYTTEEGDTDSANEITGAGENELEEMDDDEIRGGNILGLEGDISGNSVYSDDIFESPKQGRDSERFANYFSAKFLQM